MPSRVGVVVDWRKGHIPGYSGRTCSVLFSLLAWVMCRRGAAQLAQVPGSSMGRVLDPESGKGSVGGEGVSRHEDPEKEGWSHCGRQLCVRVNHRTPTMKTRCRSGMEEVPGEVGIKDGVLSVRLWCQSRIEVG